MADTKQTDKKYISRIFITVAVWTTVMFVFLPSCGKKEQATAAAVKESDSLPDMRTLGVTTLVSDSGMIRYKIITDEWLVYSHRNPPFWAFEKGVYLEKFDTLFHVDASIKADTAYYYEQKKLWELMFWDQNKEKIYSDRFIRIEQVDKVLTGYGFESNQQMTEYQIYNNTGIFTVEDTASADSTARSGGKQQ